MSEELDFMAGETPVLTFDGFAEAVQTAETAEAAAVQQPQVQTKPEEKKIEAPDPFDESKLTEQEKQMVNQFSDQIDLNNSTLVMQYGAGAQKKVADFSQTVLDNLKTKDMGEAGKMLTDVVAELQGMSEEDEGGILGFFKKKGNQAKKLKIKYDSASANVDKIVGTLQDHQNQLIKDTAMLDKMYQMNQNYFKELSMYIIAGKKKIAKVREEDLPALVGKAAETGLPEDAQAANDLGNLLNRFEKKVHDLELTRMVSIQMAPQIRLVQNNNTLMSEKIQSTIVNTIPLWKSQMVIALSVEHSNQAAKAQSEVTQLTNDLLKQNADALKMATVDTAKASERGVVDLETLVHSNEMLIQTLDEVMHIQQEGREKRMQAEQKMQDMEAELRQKLLEIRS